MRRILSIRLVCGIAGIGLALAVHFPLIEAASRMRLIHFWAVPSLHSLEEAYVEMLLRAIFAFVCVATALAWDYSRNTLTPEPQSREERLGWFFLVIPIAGYALAELITHAFAVRYFIPVLAGIALAFGCFLYRYYRHDPRVPLTILFIAIPLFLEASASQLRNAPTPIVSGRMDESDFVDAMLPRFRKDHKRFVVVPPGKSYLEARYYASDPEMLRTLHPRRYPDSWFASGILDIRYISPSEILQHPREFALVAPSADLLSRLEGRGFHIHWRMTEPEAVVYVE